MTASVNCTNPMDIERHAAEGSAPRASEAQRVLAGERQARANLARLQRDEADPDELALIMFELYGAALRGFCTVIAKALGIHHG